MGTNRNPFIFSVVTLSVGLLVTVSCGKEARRAIEEKAETPAPTSSERVCDESGARCYDLKWIEGPVDGAMNALSIGFEAGFRGEEFRNAGGRVYAQMKCCGTVVEGKTTWSPEGRLMVYGLRLRPGEWLLVIETETLGKKLQVKRALEIL